MCLDNNTHTNNNQELKILIDKNEKGKERPWRENQLKKIPLAESFKRIGLKNKASRVRGCSNQLVFKINKDTKKRKLHSMISCQVRLCPMCNWRRSLKIYGQVSKVMNKALEYKDYRFVFLTLTCKNVKGEDLSSTIDNLFKAYNLLTKRKAFKSLSNGWFRALEITHNTDKFITKDMWYGNKERRIKPMSSYYKRQGLKIGDKNPNYNLYHPHFHVVLMVNKSYFKDSKIYLKQEQWTSLWKSCLKVDYTPIVDIRAFKTSNKLETAKSVAESAKYTVKDNDYIIPNNEDLTDQAVSTLDYALSNRRLIAFGGELRNIHKALNLDDAVDGDLVNTDNENDEEVRDDIKYQLEVYNWSVGYSNYVRVE